MSEQSVPRREHCPNFIPIIVGNGNDEINSETVPLLNGNNIEEYNSIIPLDIVLAALLTIILTLAILSGIYLIIEENDWEIFTRDGHTLESTMTNK